MLEFNKMPLLPGQKQGRDVNPVDVNNLNAIGVQGGAFQLHKGDVIEFPAGEPLVVSQKVRNAPDSPLAYYVGCIRNGKESWLSISSLTRRNYQGLPIGKFQEAMCEKPSFKEVYEELAGKKIKAGEPKEVIFAVFDRTTGERTDKTVPRYIPEIEWA